MSSSVLLITDRPAFEETWRTALAGHEVDVRTSRPGDATAALDAALGHSPSSTAPSRAQVAVVVDAASPALDEDELLAVLGLARALGARPIAALDGGRPFAWIDEVVDELCQGLVARGNDDVARIATAAARRLDPARSRRFEYVTVSPSGKDLLAILGDGSAVVLARPVSSDDDGAEVDAIELAEDAVSATVALTSGCKFAMQAPSVASRAGGGNGFSTHMGGNGSNGLHVDGVKLGARLRALRLAAGLTQAELARRTGIHRPNIARVEKGRHTPSLETIARLASAIGVPTTRVFAED